MRDDAMAHLAEPLECRLASEGMAAARGDHEVLLEDAASLEARRNGIGRNDRDIELARFQLRKRLTPGSFRRGLAGHR